MFHYILRERAALFYQSAHLAGITIGRNTFLFEYRLYEIEKFTIRHCVYVLLVEPIGFFRIETSARLTYFFQRKSLRQLIHGIYFLVRTVVPA